MLDLGRFARVRLGHLPTPLEPMARFSAQLGGPKLWIKRDDCTGLATGANKTRKLEYLVLLDPVYSGKALSGLIDLLRKETFGKDENIVFVHTGGQAGLFAYEPVFAA